MSSFHALTRVTIEPGCRARAAAAVTELGGHRVLVVTDAFLSRTPAFQHLVQILREASIDVDLFASVESNPRTTTAERLGERARTCQVVLGFGGGSVLDAAKAAAMLATNDGRALDYVGRNRFTRPPLPFVAIPTTCGTGSEVTWVSVLTDPDKRVKVSLKGEGMFPDIALVDADLLVGMPPALVAATGFDALTHALEATTGLPRNPVSDALAEKAITLLLEFLPRAVSDIDHDGQAREAVMRAATLAGLAFGNSDVGGVHCLSETLGGLHDVPHGLANAMLLVPVMRSHGSSIAARLGELDAEGPAHFLGALEQRIADLGIPAFASLGIPRADYPEIAAGAVANGSNAANPRPMAAADYLRILEAL
ncbi:MAG: iron-containing alcohol dehydrogenase [Planctomycetes bacterium]|nr:iron-containing alcohol dehydrogenase [Planctomycetota bacterium]MCB9870730.1 iron-containing alcohol dehydrogenase [Planctomycetota bacterium]MCB9889065.1 iron-containing alcohol dehydrogenase [Planctomycetota bacterium]